VPLRTVRHLTATVPLAAAAPAEAPPAAEAHAPDAHERAYCEEDEGDQDLAPGEPRGDPLLHRGVPARGTRAAARQLPRGAQLPEADEVRWLCGASLHPQGCARGDPALQVAADAQAPLAALVRDVPVHVGPVLARRARLAEAALQHLRPAVRRAARLHEGRAEAPPARVLRASGAPLLHEGVHAVDAPQPAAQVDPQLADQDPAAKLGGVEVARVEHLARALRGGRDQETVRLLQVPLIEVDHGLEACALVTEARADGVTAALHHLRAVLLRASVAVHQLAAAGVPDGENRLALEPLAAVLDLLQPHVAEAVPQDGEVRVLRRLLRHQGAVPRCDLRRRRGVAEPGRRLPRISVVMEAAGLGAAPQAAVARGGRRGIGSPQSAQSEDSDEQAGPGARRHGCGTAAGASQAASGNRPTGRAANRAHS